MTTYLLLMETIELNQFNSSFRIEGNERTRSLEIMEVVARNGDSTGLNLLVIDEKDITIYTQPLNPSGETAVGKRFAFYDHLSVKVEAETPDTPFTVEVRFA